MSVGTIVTLLIVAAALVGIAVHFARVRRSGRHITCEDCPSCGKCSGGCHADNPFMDRGNAQTAPSIRDLAGNVK